MYAKIIQKSRAKCMKKKLVCMNPTLTVLLRITESYSLEWKTDAAPLCLWSFFNKHQSFQMSYIEIIFLLLLILKDNLTVDVHTKEAKNKSQSTSQKISRIGLGRIEVHWSLQVLKLLNNLGATLNYTNSPFSAVETASANQKDRIPVWEGGAKLSDFCVSKWEKYWNSFWTISERTDCFLLL